MSAMRFRYVAPELPTSTFISVRHDPRSIIIAGPHKMPRLLEVCSGTGSVGRVFAAAGWEVVSLDVVAAFEPTPCGDMMEWDFATQFPEGHFDHARCSPPCAMYSIARTRAKTPRDLEGTDAMVRRCIEIIAYFRPRSWTLENPATGLLPNRAVAAALGKPAVVTYCSYGYPYQKKTAIWSNFGEAWQPRAACDRKTCPQCIDGLHKCTAQRGALKGRPADRAVARDELYTIPPELVGEWVAAATA